MDTAHLHHFLLRRRGEYLVSDLLTCQNAYRALQILQTVAGNGRGISYIYAGRVLSGVGIGAISAVSPAYVSECSPKEVRGRITGLFQIMVAFGVMISYFMNCESSLHDVFPFYCTFPDNQLDP